jgi:enoyl-CoA hydratase/carnithine racemase
MEATRMSDVQTELRGGIGFITLSRPKALNALSLSMIRDLTAVLLVWRNDAAVQGVAIRGMGKDPANPGGSAPFGAFCAGGDIRFFHQAALAGDPSLEDFFTEEYTLNHLIHSYPKPYIAFMDGIVMGGGMGISQGAAVRIVTERTKMAMPETNIGLFPDVGGGYFLSRCPGRMGEYLALTGQMLGGAEALAVGLADAVLAASALPALWDALGQGGFASPDAFKQQLASLAGPRDDRILARLDEVDRHFAHAQVTDIVASLEADPSAWAQETAAALRKRSPLMLHVVREQIRRARSMSLAEDLRMERDLVRHCFHLRPGASETVEGVRALAVDKDHTPKWNPQRVEDVTPAMVAPFFESPWPAHAHPLRALA